MSTFVRNTFGKAVRVPTLRRTLREFNAGKSTKTSIERELGVYGHKGKWITRAWNDLLGVDTTGVRSGGKVSA